MRIIEQKNLLNVSGGTGITTGGNNVEKDESSIYAKVVVPESVNGQTANLQIRITENTFINKLMY